jgi:peptidoglycan/LPS O-acetylase OafA/YrhL
MAAESPLKASAGPKKSSTYIPALDGLRAIAFFCVFGAHTNGRTFGNYVPATFGVTLFFFLSGYLITTLLRGEAQKTGTIALKDFYIRRALRIFIPMYIAFVVSELVGKLAFGDWHLNRLGFFSAIFYFYNYARMFPPEPLLPRGFDVTWSLSVEEHFYLLFPLMYLTMLRSRLSREIQVRILLVLCIAGLCWRTYVSYHNFPADWTYYATDCRFDSILWGCLLALWTNPVYDATPRLLERWGGALAALSFFIILGTMAVGKLHFITDPQNLRYQDTLRYSLQGFCLYFIFFFAISNINHWSVHWLENRVLRYVGWLSYSLYLVHMSFEHAIELHPRFSSWITSPAVFAASFAYAIALRHLVELPIQKLRAKYRHTPPPVTALPVEDI